MVADPFILALDLGTTHVKAVAVAEDPRVGVIGSTTSGYPLRRPSAFAAEQDPREWWEAIATAVTQLLRGPRVSGRLPAAISLSGQMHGVVLVDDRGRVLRPCLTWADERSTAELKEMAARVPNERVMAITGNSLNAAFSAAKILWLKRNDQEAWESTRTILLPKDYLRACLTGDRGSDVSDASGTLLLDLTQRTWSSELLDAWGIDDKRLPTIRESSEPGGELNSSAAEELGLVRGIPVVTGAGDALAAALGLGIVTHRTDSAEIGMLTLGTAGQIIVPSETAVVDPKGRIHGLAHAQRNAWCLMAAIPDAGGAIAWLGEVIGEHDFGALVNLAATAPPGAEGLIFIPYLSGQRTPDMDPKATASLHGLRSRHRRAAVARAVLEGVAYSFRDGLEVLHELGRAPSSLRVAGGGSAWPLWPEILASVLRLPVEVTVNPHASAIGAAMLAMSDVDWMARIDSVSSSLGARVEPTPADVLVYEDRYRAYLTLRSLVDTTGQGSA